MLIISSKYMTVTRLVFWRGKVVKFMIVTQCFNTIINIFYYVNFFIIYIYIQNQEIFDLSQFK